MRNLARRVMRSSQRGTRRLLFGPAPADSIVHCSHHKAGTVWFRNVLGGLARAGGLRFVEMADSSVPRDTDVILYQHSRLFDRAAWNAQTFRGSHIIRDPRDVVVSGYFYHLWTSEEWANRPDPRFGGRTYKQELNRVDQERGIQLEIERVCGTVLVDMLAWDYAQPEFLELKYEDLIQDELGVFETILRHYGLSDRMVRRGLAVVERSSFAKQTTASPGTEHRKSHLRSGKSGQWHEYFSAHHVRSWEGIAGDAAQVLGYA